MKHKPDFIFETSWEVCNKVGGIYAVLSTRAASMQKMLKDKVVFIGPELWKDQENPYFKPVKSLLQDWQKAAKKEGLKVRVGRWNVPGQPIAVLVDFSEFWAEKDSIYGKVWERFGVDSLHAYGDYDESSMFGYATGKVIESIYNFYKLEDKKVVAHFNEWMTTFGLFYVKMNQPKIATLFTTHATSIGRSIAGNNKPLYDYFLGYNGDQMADELNMQSKHSTEKQAAFFSDCFTTVSDITDRECLQLLDKSADIVTPNGFESGFLPKTTDEFNKKRTAARRKLLSVASAVVGHDIEKNSLLVCLSGRYEWKNKGIDAFLSSLAKLKNNSALKKRVVAFIMVPAWQCGAHSVLGSKDNYTTHQVVRPQDDPTINTLRWLNINNQSEDKVNVVFVPSYLKGDDGIFNMSYYDLLIGMDLSVFPSYYEPWGYTPLESVAFHVPTITTDIAGFGLWAMTEKDNKSVSVVHRTDSNWDEMTNEIADNILRYSNLKKTEVEALRDKAALIASHADWKHFFKYYEQAYNIALSKIYK